MPTGVGRVPSTQQRASRIPVAFVAYQQVDQRLVDVACEHLRNSETPWMLSEAIPYVDHWRELARAKIDDADAFIFVLTVASIQSAACEFEWRYAVTQSKSIIRVDLDGVPPDRIPNELAGVPAISASSENADEAAESLHRVLDGLAGG